MRSQLLALVLLLTAVTGAIAQPTDTLTLATGADRSGRQRMSGRVVDYTGDTLRWENAAGSEVAISADRVVAIDSDWNPAHATANELFDSGQYEAAMNAYARAIGSEERLWVRRLILSRAVWCCRNTGQVHRAVRTFLALVSSDPNTPYFDCIPLAWVARTSDPALSATANQAMSVNAPPAAQLLGASWLLTTSERARAVETLKRLATLQDAKLALLADAQLRRGQLAASNAQQVGQIERAVRNMPVGLRAGPSLLLGDALAISARHAEAARAYLRVPVLHPLAGDLAPEAWYRAGRALEAEGRREEAALAWNTLLREHGQSNLAAAARTRLEQLDSE